jgi:hypothetical protein
MIGYIWAHACNLNAVLETTGYDASRMC